MINVFNLNYKYKIYIRGVKNSINIFREENIPLFTKMETRLAVIEVEIKNMNKKLDKIKVK